jgi:hypothetical protein
VALREELLWVDQVRINQSDSREISHLVDLMRDIYAGAERVLVCLTSQESFGPCLGCMKEMRKQGP